MEGTVEHRLPPETSIFSAELWAIYQAVLAAGDLQLSKCVIFSDSESALEALRNSNSTQRNYLIYYIKQAYIEVTKRGTEIVLFWVPAHCGIPGNELADQCAKRAALGTCRPRFWVPYEDLLALSRIGANNHQEEYMRRVSVYEGKGTQYDLFYTSSTKTWFHKESLSRREIVHINRLRSNHVNTYESLYRIGIVSSSACPCGDSRQTVNHLIFHCELFNKNSLSIRNYIAKKFPDSPQDLLPALSSPSPRLCRLVLAFMTANDLLF
ncbi:hypothetical protein ALC60_04432 [Trachymyrmex zeteki]|uniref:RNase H type-1 domain-containing protein n=1 Tax=Mycetomoellerius zeteki TaxID=64791 RepID=A0A151X8C7_9HYME|nr:hypothetical protein ALC60_04432 [Trachymyrmex zeteki]